MKKNIAAAIAAIALCCGAAAQGRVSIDYDIAEKEPLTRDLMKFLDVEYIKITVHGDIKGKKWVLYSHLCSGDSITTKPIFSHPFEFSDTTATFTIFAQQLGTDSAYIACDTPRYGGAKTKYAIDAKNDTSFPASYILMETFPEKPYTVSDRINLAAYTTGIRMSSTSYSYCDLRDKKSDPETWQKEYGIPRFVFFSLKLE